MTRRSGRFLGLCAVAVLALALAIAAPAAPPPPTPPDLTKNTPSEKLGGKGLAFAADQAASIMPEIHKSASGDVTVDAPLRLDASLELERVDGSNPLILNGGTIHAGNGFGDNGSGTLHLTGDNNCSGPTKVAESTLALA